MKTRQTEEEVRRQHQEMDRPGVRQVPEGSGEQGKMQKTGCKIICGAPTTLAVKGLMMIITIITVGLSCLTREISKRSVSGLTAATATLVRLVRDDIHTR